MTFMLIYMKTLFHIQKKNQNHNKMKFKKKAFTDK